MLCSKCVSHVMLNRSTKSSTLKRKRNKWKHFFFIIYNNWTEKLVSLIWSKNKKSNEKYFFGLENVNEFNYNKILANMTCFLRLKRQYLWRVYPWKKIFDVKVKNIKVAFLRRARVELWKTTILLLSCQQ